MTAPTNLRIETVANGYIVTEERRENAMSAPSANQTRTFQNATELGAWISQRISDPLERIAKMEKE